VISEHSDRVSDFIRQQIASDTKTGLFDGQVHTRFPPEPNGYLHIGHAASICLNFDIAEEFGGRCNLRYDDTNPSREEQEYVDSQKADLKWLGFDWGSREFYTSDYFDQLYNFALRLINDSKAYVDNMTAIEIRNYRGTLTEPGINSPYRNRSVAENLELFEKMKAGGYSEGQAVLRAKIDMTSPNINLRDPVMYRVIETPHHRTQNRWHIYPMYDFAHGQSDSIEGITHSICTMEYEDHRPLYDWFLNALGLHHPRQIEFARINLSHTVLSKRKLNELVSKGYVNGWDDPRMPTLAGMRRRGYPPHSIREFCKRIGISKNNATTDIALLQHNVRDALNKTSKRAMAVLKPLKIVITNFPEDEIIWLEAMNNPGDLGQGTRKIPFGREIYIEEDDFMEIPPKKFFRLSPGKEVRLRYGYFIKCHDVKKGPDGKISEIHCTYDASTLGGASPDGRKVKATLHWVSAKHSIPAEIRLYDHLFTEWDPNLKDDDWENSINPESLITIRSARLEPSLKNTPAGENYQFERLGYFAADDDASKTEENIFNRTVTLRDTWARIKSK